MMSTNRRFPQTSSRTVFLLIAAVLLAGCGKSNPANTEPGPGNHGNGNGGEPSEADSLDPGILDDYSDISHISYFSEWGSYNVHDPTLIKHGDTYYMYSTDVYFGGAGVPQDDPRLDPKIPIRKSENLVHWTPIGHVFSEMPGQIVAWLRQIQPSYEPLSVWAPFVMEVDGQFRLYYSVPANDGLQTAYLGLAISSHPEGPWEHKGLVLPTYDGSEYNGIDPAVMVDRDNGKHWLFFGSWWDGIHAVELDPATGFRLDSDDTGTVVAARNPDQFGSSPMEGAEVLYHPGRDQYYIFVSYDPLIEEYNVRVGRADQPQGPYYDFFGNEMSLETDNLPRITAQYRFNNHLGWQGVGHTGLLRDGEDYYLASQGRLGSNEPTIHLMNLHLRKMVWTEDGWPTLYPERYAAIPQVDISEEDIIGSWEHITLDLINQKNLSTSLTFTSDGGFEEYGDGSWSLDNKTLTIQLSAGTEFLARVMRGWDWENDDLCLMFTGLNEEGISEWGKRVAENSE